MRRRAFLAVVLLAGAALAAPRAETQQASLGVQVTVVQRCVVATAPDASVTLRCTRGTRSARAALDGSVPSVVPLAPQGSSLAGTARLQAPSGPSSGPQVLTVDF